MRELAKVTALDHVTKGSQCRKTRPLNGDCGQVRASFVRLIFRINHIRVGPGLRIGRWPASCLTPRVRHQQSRWRAQS